MIEAGEVDIAIDELRWLLGGCSDFIAAHRMLGEAAMLESDIPLARGHFGYAFQIGVKALDQAGVAGRCLIESPRIKRFWKPAKGWHFA